MFVYNGGELHIETDIIDEYMVYQIKAQVVHGSTDPGLYL
jgi:hypothetical protein